MTETIKVVCYAGYKADEKPRAFHLGDRKMQVAEIIDQWYGPDHTYFKVKAEDNNLYILRYGKKEDYWELVFFKDGTYIPADQSKGAKTASS